MARDTVQRIWPEINWIENEELREQVVQCWVRAFELSPLVPEDLERIPFTLKVPGCTVSFLAHKRLVVHVARESGLKIREFFGDALPVDMDVLIAGSILADVGKLLEYELAGGKVQQSGEGASSRCLLFHQVGDESRGEVGWRSGTVITAQLAPLSTAAQIPGR